MNRIITNCIFIIATAGVILTFITATTYAQLSVAIILYPLLIFFAFKTFPRKNSIFPTKEPVTIIPATVKSEENVAAVNTDNNIGITDIDKRVFLKLIGGAGVALFLYSIFNKKAEGLFFKSLPASGLVSLQDIAGNKIDPAQNQPTDGYRISEIDDNNITFYGFTNKDGGWFIMREDTDTGSFRYAKGDSNFPANWANRENLNYDYYNNIF